MLRPSRPTAAAIGFFGCGPAFLLCLVGGYLLLVALIFGSNPFDPNPFDNATFNRSIWIEDESCSDGSNRRGSMAEDILKHRLHKGMTVEQVTTLLDNPEWNADHTALAEHPARFKAEEKQAARVLVYYLGEELGGVQQGRPIDRAWLDLSFDANDCYIGGRIWLP